MTNLVEIFQDTATAMDYKFIYGAREFINYDLTNEDLKTGSFLVALFPITQYAVKITNGHKIYGWRANITIWFGRKFEDTTVSELDETYKQKYDRRLFDCQKELITYLEAVLCVSDLELKSLRISEQINEFSENVDFVSCDMQAEYQI